MTTNWEKTGDCDALVKLLIVQAVISM
jgi:hypothetical protein